MNCCCFFDVRSAYPEAAFIELEPDSSDTMRRAIDSIHQKLQRKNEKEAVQKIIQLLHKSANANVSSHQHSITPVSPATRSSSVTNPHSFEKTGVNPQLAINPASEFSDKTTQKDEHSIKLRQEAIIAAANIANKRLDRSHDRNESNPREFNDLAQFNGADEEFEARVAKELGFEKEPNENDKNS